MFKRITNLFKKGYSWLIGRDEEQLKPQPQTKPKNIFKRMVERIRPAKTSKGKGTMKNIPTGKMSDFEPGHGKGQKSSKTKGKVTDKTSISESEKDKLKRLIEEYNESIVKFREELIEAGHEYFDPITASNMEDYITMAVEREKRRFTDNVYDDLRELSEEAVFSKITDDFTLQQAIEKLEGSDYYNLEKRNELYRENWINALKNEYGENSDTLRIISKVKDMDLDTFMLSYYNQWADVWIGVIYDVTQQGQFLKRVEDFFDDLNEKSKK